MSEEMSQSTDPSRGGRYTTTQRTYAWADPGQGDLSAVAALDGFGQLKAMVDGDLPWPPIMDTLGIAGFTLDPGSVSVSARAQEFQYNPLGSVHGGVISMLLDTAAACSVHTTLAAGEFYTSLDLNVKFVRPLTAATGMVTATGQVLQRGRRTALAEAHLRDEGGKLLAHATSSCMIF